MKRHSKRTLALLLQLALLIWLGSACATLKKAPPVADITGDWKANVETPEGDLEILLYIKKSSGGDLEASISVPVMGAYDVPLTFSYENGVVHYEIEGVGVDFDGKLIDPSTIEGLQSQPGGGEPGTITYKRVN